MKTLTLLRHAKSGGADDPGLLDVDRPLNEKGFRAAERMGRHLAELDLRFDAVIASPARRVAETLQAVSVGYGRPIKARTDRRLYLASPDTLIEVAREQQAERVLLVGHTPGLEELVLTLVPPNAGDLREEVAAKYPTASVAEMTFSGDWADVAPGTATLTRFVRPRDLDPTLGPDAV